MALVGITHLIIKRNCNTKKNNKFLKIKIILLKNRFLNNAVHFYALRNGELSSFVCWVCPFVIHTYYQQNRVNCPIYLRLFLRNFHPLSPKFGERALLWNWKLIIGWINQLLFRVARCPMLYGIPITHCLHHENLGEKISKLS